MAIRDLAPCMREREIEVGPVRETLEHGRRLAGFDGDVFARRALLQDLQARPLCPPKRKRNERRPAVDAAPAAVVAAPEPVIFSPPLDGPGNTCVGVGGCRRKHRAESSARWTTQTAVPSASVARARWPIAGKETTPIDVAGVAVGFDASPGGAVAGGAAVARAGISGGAGTSKR